MTTLVQRASARFVSRLLLGHGFGAIPAPCGNSLFCFEQRRPEGYGIRTKSCSRSAAKRFLQSLRKCRASALGSRAPRLASPGVTRAGSGNSTNGDKIMYQNKVNLIGFLGSDAEVRTANNRSFTTLSLATKSSYKDKRAASTSRIPNGIVAWSSASSAEFAGTLTKGAHVQVEGELRSRQYDSKKTDSNSASGRSAWIRSSSWTGPRRPPQESRQATTLRARSRPHRPLLFTFGSPVTRGASEGCGVPL